MPSSQIASTALEFTENWFAGRLEEAFALTTDDFTFTIPGDPATFPMAGTFDKESYLALRSQIGEAMPNGIVADIQHCLAEGDLAVVLIKSTGTSRSGRAYENDMCYALEFRDGRVASCREYLDTMHANEVMVADAQ